MSALSARLEKELGDLIRTDPETLAAHRHDSWVLAQLFDVEGRTGPSPLGVVFARSTQDVQRTLRLCRELRVPVIPFGGGSGVCGAIEASEGVVVLSTRQLEGLVELDDRDLLARFRAGTMGIDAEMRVQQDGLTIGQWPQSVDLSTVGGWVATRAAGQFSTAYGNIEDMVFGLEAVLPDGSLFRTRETPRAAAGPDLRHLFLGSEGSLGVITEVTFSLRPLPETSQGQAFHFPTLEQGLEAIRLFMREGWRPPVVRLYDAEESGRQFADFCPPDRAILILLHEGPAAAVNAQLQGVAAVCSGCGGVETDSASVDKWLDHRNKVPSLRELLEKGIVADTIEVGATWERIGGVYETVIQSLRQVPDLLVASAHSSHSYRSGTNLYFTFAVRPQDPAEMAQRYQECWRRTMEATLEAGGGISHHHGIGRIRKNHLSQELGASGVALLRAVKNALDPDQLLNPGALLPDEDSS